MSERTHAPRSGGRTTEQRSRDADTQGRAARGARQSGDEADSRRSGMRRDEGTRGRSRETELPRSRARDASGSGSVRDHERDTTPTDRPRDAGRVREPGAAGSRPRDEDRARMRPRDTDGLRIKPRGPREASRDIEGRAGARNVDGRARARDTDGVRAKARDTDGLRVKGRKGAVAARDRKAPARRGVTTNAAGDRGRGGKVVDAPVDGTAALMIDLDVPPETSKASDSPRTPWLRVAPPAPISAPRAPFVAAVLGVVVVGVLGILLINTKTNENSFRIADLEKQNSALDNQRQDLDNQLVEASSIGNLDAAARRLGMVKADKLALFRLPDGKVIGVPTPTDGKVAVTAQDAKGTDTAPVEDKGAANVKPADGTATGTATQPTQPTLGDGQTQQGQTQQGQTQQGQTQQGQTQLGQTQQGQPQLGQGQPQVQQGQPQVQQGQGQQGQQVQGQEQGQDQTSGTGQ
jgi:hypothetical protein